MGVWFRQKGICFFAFLLLFLSVFLQVVPVHASDNGALHTLTVSCSVEDIPQEGKSFDLYRVGAFASSSYVVYEDVFAGRDFPNEISDSEVYQDLSVQIHLPGTGEMTLVVLYLGAAVLIIGGGMVLYGMNKKQKMMR